VRRSGPSVVALFVAWIGAAIVAAAASLWLLGVIG
jgi:hypothetical protein